MMAKKYGKWLVIKSIGEGGQAHVYLVEHEDSSMKAVLKRLKNSNRLDRFKMEIDALNKIRTKAIVQVLDSDIASSPSYFITPYYENGNLEKNIDLVQSWPPLQKLSFLKNIAEGLIEAHNIKIYHRDIKPRNILLDGELNPIIVDFGLCYFENNERNTLLDEAVGSFQYMAPEVEDGQSDKIGPWTDVYSLSKLAYWLFKGRIFNREKHRDEQWNLSSVFNDHWVHYFNDLLDKTLITNPIDRMQSMTEFRHELNRILYIMENNNRYLSLKENQKCLFCGLGDYQVQVDYFFSNDSSNQGYPNTFGFSQVAGSKWLVLSCNYCGNIQAFRKDLIRGYSNWK